MKKYSEAELEEALHWVTAQIKNAEALGVEHTKVYDTIEAVLKQAFKGLAE